MVLKSLLIFVFIIFVNIFLYYDYNKCFEAYKRENNDLHNKAHLLNRSRIKLARLIAAIILALIQIVTTIIILFRPE